MYGIDSPVRQLANQNAGNPQQLMQSYAQDPSLVKLLALEQLKQDLAAREASISAQMQGNPATILQQREQEVLGGISGARDMGSVTEQTAGSLNQQARQQQQQAPQQGGNPMEQGIASQPATNMQRMASGGIVGFSEGGSLSKRDKIFATQLRARDPTKFDGKTDAQVLDMVRQEPHVSPGERAWKEANARRREPPATLEPAQGASSAPVITDLIAPVTSAGGIGSIGYPGGAAFPARPESAVPPQGQAGGSQQSSTGVDTSGIASLTHTPLVVPELAAQSPEMAALAAKTQAMFEQGANRNSGAEGTAARNEAAKFYGREDKQAERDAFMQKLRTADTTASDPKKLARERFISGLIGTRGTGGLGSWARSSSQASNATASAQKAAQDKRNAEIYKAMTEGQAADTGIATSSLGEGANVRAEAEDAKTAGIAGIAGIVTADAKTRADQQELSTDVAIANQASKLGVDTANIQATLDKAKIEAQNATNLLTAKGQDLNALMASRDRNVALIAEITANIQAESSQTVAALRKEAEGESPDSEEAVALKAAVDAQKMLIAKATAANRKAIEDIYNRLGDSSNTDTTGYTASAK